MEYVNHARDGWSINTQKNRLHAYRKKKTLVSCDGLLAGISYQWQKVISKNIHDLPVSLKSSIHIQTLTWVNHVTPQYKALTISCLQTSWSLQKKIVAQSSER